MHWYFSSFIKNEDKISAQVIIISSFGIIYIIPTSDDRPIDQGDLGPPARGFLSFSFQKTAADSLRRTRQ
jgi:hypothetical protein